MVLLRARPEDGVAPSLARAVAAVGRPSSLSIRTIVMPCSLSAPLPTSGSSRRLWCAHVQAYSGRIPGLPTDAQGRAGPRGLPAGRATAELPRASSFHLLVPPVPRTLPAAAMYRPWLPHGPPCSWRLFDAHPVVSMVTPLALPRCPVFPATRTPPPPFSTGLTPPRLAPGAASVGALLLRSRRAQPPSPPPCSLRRCCVGGALALLLPSPLRCSIVDAAPPRCLVCLPRQPAPSTAPSLQVRFGSLPRWSPP